ncbi:hypothetical protein Tco_0788365 [Tanacetum coccineum]
MCHISGIEPQFENIISNGPYIPMAAGQRKPEIQWTHEERKAANLDQRLKSLIMSVLPDDQMNYVINCLTAKSTWDDLILYHEGPSDVKESRYKALMNELVNDGIKLSNLEINTGFINGLPKKWLAFFSAKDFQDSPDDEEDTKNQPKQKRDEEEVSSGDNEVTEVKTLMALADEERISVGKESARNEAWLNGSNKVNQCISEQIPTQKKKILGIDQPTKDTSSSGLKDPVFVISLADNSKVSIIGSNKPNVLRTEDSTLSNHNTSKRLIMYSADESSVYSTPFPPLVKLTGAEPLLLEATKVLQLLKTNSAPAGKLKNVKMEDDPPLDILMKELNELKLQISKNKSSYFRNKNSQQYKRTNQRTCDHAEFMSSMNINQYHISQGESSSRSRPSRPAIPFPSCIHCGYNDHKYDYCVYYPICEICGSYDHDTPGHNRIISLRRGIKPRNPQHVTKNCETCGVMFIPHQIIMTLSGSGKEKLFKLRKLSLSKQVRLNHQVL